MKITKSKGNICEVSPRVSMTPAGNQTIPRDIYKFIRVEQMRAELLSIMHHEHVRCVMDIHDSSWMQMLRRGYSLGHLASWVLVMRRKCYEYLWRMMSFTMDLRMRTHDPSCVLKKQHELFMRHLGYACCMITMRHDSWWCLMPPHGL